MIYVSMPYTANEVFERMDQATWSELRDLWPTKKGLPQEKPDRFWYSSFEETRMTMEEAHHIEQRFGIVLEVKSWGGTMVTKLRDQGYNYDARTPSASDLLSGRAVQLAIPDLGLLLIDEVTHLDDACTDELQTHLNDGWRILAVCPPNAQRRPDYILGRRRRTET